MLSKLFPLLLAAAAPIALSVDARSVNLEPNQHVSRADEAPLVFAHFMVSNLDITQLEKPLNQLRLVS
jgi:hypothetical protein